MKKNNISKHLPTLFFLLLMLPCLALCILINQCLLIIGISIHPTVYIIHWRECCCENERSMSAACSPIYFCKRGMKFYIVMITIILRVELFEWRERAVISNRQFFFWPCRFWFDHWKLMFAQMKSLVLSIGRYFFLFSCFFLSFLLFLLNMLFLYISMCYGSGIQMGMEIAIERQWNV